VTQDTVKFCPQCASANVDFSSLAGGQARCHGCNWMGPVDDLMSVPIQHDFALGKESIIQEMMTDVRKFLSAELGLPWLKFLLKWGFVEGDLERLGETLDRKKFARYLAAIGRATLVAVIDERAKQSREAAQKVTSDGAGRTTN
jgi:hypothetical protein